MPADGTMAARSPGEEFGTSRFKGQLSPRITYLPVAVEGRIVLPEKARG